MFDVPAEFVWPARLATVLLVSNVILLSLADVPRAVLQGENLGYKRMGLSAILVFVTGGGTNGLSHLPRYGHCRRCGCGHRDDMLDRYTVFASGTRPMCLGLAFASRLSTSDPLVLSG